jgi:hypothetical protein
MPGDKQATRGKEVERLAAALTKGILELNWVDYLPREPGETEPQEKTEPQE